MKARGRIILDAWWEAKTTFRPKKESLEAVSQLVLGEGKDEIDTSQIEYEWENRREEVIKYCEKDASLALRILDRTQSVKRGMALSYVAMLPLADILTGTTSNLIDSILIREADRADIGIPLTRHERKTAKIEGAGFWTRLFSIVLPQRMFALAAVWLIGFAVSFADLSASVLVVPPGVTTLPVRIFGLLHAGVDDQVAGVGLNLLAGGAVIATVIVWLLKRTSTTNSP